MAETMSAAGKQVRKRRRASCTITVLVFVGGGILVSTIAEYRLKHTPDALLFRAIEDGSVDQVKYWLQHGASANTTGKPSRDTGILFWYRRIKSPEYPEEATPLMYAVDYPEVVQLLLDGGADPCGKNQEALLVAARRGDTASIRLLLKTPFPPTVLQSALSTAVVCGYRDLFPLLLRYGARVNGVNQYGMSPLFEAVLGRQWSNAEYLLSLGADTNLSETKEGQTALIRVTLLGSVEGVAWLLKHNAKVNLRDKRGLTALSYACKFERGGRGKPLHPDTDRNFKTVAELLRRAGAVE